MLHVRLPQLGLWHWEEEPLRVRGMEGQQGLITGFHGTGGNKNSTLRGHPQGIVHIQIQEKKAVILQKPGLDLPVGFEGSPEEVEGEQATLAYWWGQGHLQ